LWISVEKFHESLIQISVSSIVALEDLWSVSDADEDRVSLLDTLPDPGVPDPQTVIEKGDIGRRIADAIAALQEREQLAIALYYYENLSLREIGGLLPPPSDGDDVSGSGSRVDQNRAAAQIGSQCLTQLHLGRVDC
jgi:RNA polymerase sigma factor for flagellar operon FliA